MSQRGSFEVPARLLAVERTRFANVEVFAANNVADREKGNDELKTIAGAQSLLLAPGANAEAQIKFDRLGRLSGSAFHNAHLGEMTKIHRKDEGIFAHEAKVATSGDWKAFAARTDGIVEVHIGMLD